MGIPFSPSSDYYEQQESRLRDEPGAAEAEVDALREAAATGTLVQPPGWYVQLLEDVTGEPVWDEPEE